MAETIIAPAPPGVQSTFEKPLGPQPSKSEHAQKFRKAFAELTQADVKPKAETVEAPKEEPKVSEPPKEPPKESPPAAPPTDKKPESPLDAVLSKTPTKEPEKVEEPDVLKEFPVEIDTKDEKQKVNWSRARTVMGEQAQKIKQFQSRISELEKNPKAEPSVIEALTKERDELQTKYQKQEERLKAINAEYSEEFQGLLAQREGVLGKISSRMKAYGGDANALIEALALPEGKIKTAQIKEAMAEIDPDDKPRIHALIEQLETHDEKISDFRKDLPKKWDELTAKREVQLAEQSHAAIKQLEAEFGKIVETIPASTVTLREVPDDVPGAAEWNQEIRAAQENALRALKPNGADFNESVAIAMKGARYDSLEKRYLSLHSDYSDLKQKYNEAVGAGPDFKGGTKAKVDVQKSAPKKYHETLAAIRSGQAGEF